uniref:Uncharacterized protein n=1 Tax=viral metagenome TaxID=1070528 RepID=A0A6C0KD17_9ZZZZ
MEKLVNTASLEDFERGFNTAAGSGLFVSIGVPNGVKFDGSGSVLRKDASWLTWDSVTGSHAWGYVWDPKDNDELVVCGYAMDADTDNRRTNGQFDRCGMWMGVPTQVYPLVLLLTGLLLFAIAHSILNSGSSVAVGVLTVVFFTWCLWIIDRSKYGRQRGKATFATGDGVIQKVLREQKFVYGCPNPKNASDWRYLVLFLAVSGFGAAFAASKQKQTPFVIAGVFFATLTVAAAIVGYTKGNRQLNPLPSRCVWENEFVYLPQVEDMVTLEYLRAHSAKMPVALLYIYQPGEEWDRDEYVLQTQFWHGDTPVLKMTLATDDKPHKFDGVFNISDESSLSDNHKS